MAESEAEKTPLQQKLDEFGEQLSEVAITNHQINIQFFLLRLSQLFV